jgi:hypothetical protein
MTHIEELQAEKEALIKKKEAIQTESFNLKIRARFNEKRIKAIDAEIKELSGLDTVKSE